MYEKIAVFDGGFTDRELSIREKNVENDSVDLEIRISEDCVFPSETRKSRLEFLIGKFLIINYTVHHELPTGNCVVFLKNIVFVTQYFGHRPTFITNVSVV